MPLRNKNKIQSQASLRAIIRSLKKQGKRVVFTNGCFDIAHRGHVEYLKKARAKGDILIVAVNGDRSVKKIKGPGRPLNSIADRMAVLSAFEFVDYVTSFNEPTPLEIIKKLRPDVLIKGADWKAKDIVGRGVVESLGGEVATVSYRKGYSTTELIRRIGSLKKR
ncbi:MAG: D-glycero-beta-D-manno-heptose 1-phosphate adenylyltransferase [Candidatus Omnitrophota bacterium]